MDVQELARYGRHLEHLIEGTVTWELDRAVDRVVEQQDWELLGHVLLTAAEVSAQRIIAKLLELEVYEPLVWAACLRRQVRRPQGVAGATGVSRRVFRDWDAEENAQGVPEHIRADAEELSKQAEQTRAAMLQRAAEVDRDPIRDHIIARLADRLATSPAALDALLVITKASAWEETRRGAALKIAAHPMSVSRLARELRSADLIAVADASGLSAVAANIAKVMGSYLDQFKAAGDDRALAFLAEHHPEDATKAAAAQARQN